MFRSKDQSQQRIAADFRDWGIPTAYALEKLGKSNLGKPIIASGGIQNGIDILKCLVLGADLCGIAGKLFLAAIVSTEKVIEVIDEIENETKIAMFACGTHQFLKLSKYPL
jgi:isopentenyl-diphosphate delta-isomerase